MQFHVTSQTPDHQSADCYIFAVAESAEFSSELQQFDQQHNVVAPLQALGDLPRQCGDIRVVYVPNQPLRAVLVGSGDSTSVTPNQFIKMLKAVTNTLKQLPTKAVLSTLAHVSVVDRDGDWKVRQSIQTTLNSYYRFDELKTVHKPADFQPESFTLTVAADELSAADHAVKTAKAVAQGMDLCRRLGDRPGNVCTPSHLAEQAVALGEEYSHVNTTILGEAEMTELGMETLLSVGKGSAQESKLIIMEYRNGPEGQAPVALVGKGVTMDTGGISIKPSPKMDEMKYDMGGAASVFGAIKACAEMNLPINVVAVIPSVQNMPGSQAICPGDIVTSLSGKTVEILNTDAEGRLILCDAITYSMRYKPDVIIDVATLTGACIVALGHINNGLFSNDDQLSQTLLECGEISHDGAWRLPVGGEYDDMLTSPFADIPNMGNPWGVAGSVIAACFLQRFVEGVKWAHIDCAGTAWTSSPKGASGRPVPLLTEYLLRRC